MVAARLHWAAVRSQDRSRNKNGPTVAQITPTWATCQVTQVRRDPEATGTDVVEHPPPLKSVLLEPEMHQIAKHATALRMPKSSAWRMSRCSVAADSGLSHHNFIGLADSLVSCHPT